MRCVVLDASLFAPDEPGERSPCHGLGRTGVLRLAIDLLDDAHRCRIIIYVPDVASRSGEHELLAAARRVFSEPLASAMLRDLTSRGKLVIKHVPGDRLGRKLAPIPSSIGDKDAAYLWLALRLSRGPCSKVTLYTCDGTLARAARQTGLQAEPGTKASSEQP